MAAANRQFPIPVSAQDAADKAVDRRAFLGFVGRAVLPLVPFLAGNLGAFGQTLEALLDAEAMVPTDHVKIPPAYRRQRVTYNGREPPGTAVIDRHHYFLYLVMDDGTALRYGCGLGKQGFAWSGRAEIGSKQIWPDWYPPKEMRERRPELPEYMPGGLDNPLGARALYLIQNGRDTLYRIHGTREAFSIGHAVSSGCVRLMNEDVIDLYDRLPIGAKVLTI
jgi:lipoprotein-anchoring transpeptidase ErfK/SrfK